jgi:hypothetical protein
MRSKAHTALTAPLVLHHTKIYKCAMKKIIFNGQMRNELYIIVIAMVLKKRLNFFFFQWPKVNQVRNEYSPQLSKLMA